MSMNSWKTQIMNDTFSKTDTTDPGDTFAITVDTWTEVKIPFPFVASAFDGNIRKSMIMIKERYFEVEGEADSEA